MVYEPLSTKDFVEKYDLMAKKALGQNFLLDQNITDKIIRLSLKAQGKDSFEGDVVLEVGPGPGGLTQSTLKQHPKQMTVIEMDERCLNILKEIQQFYPVLEIINGDALKFDWQLKKDSVGKFHIVSNLPYNISVVLLTEWLKKIENFKSLTLMFQKEVADRILAHTGTKDYGRLSVISQLQCEVIRLFDLPPTCFVPAPKIWSSVLLFLPKKQTLDKEIMNKVEMLTSIAFSQRRKMIRQSLKAVPNIVEHLQSLGLEATLRAENLEPDDYLDIAKRLP